MSTGLVRPLLSALSVAMMGSSLVGPSYRIKDGLFPKTEAWIDAANSFCSAVGPR